ncbi:hypothetical protein HYX13_01560 [Candidatus Woesearchaeota archaeon]|nr:hypothetical protein [Candidatus Woesearchaeota archaeon]
MVNNTFLSLALAVSLGACSQNKEYLSEKQPSLSGLQQEEFPEQNIPHEKEQSPPYFCSELNFQQKVGFIHYVIITEGTLLRPNGENREACHEKMISFEIEKGAEKKTILFIVARNSLDEKCYEQHNSAVKQDRVDLEKGVSNSRTSFLQPVRNGLMIGIYYPEITMSVYGTLEDVASRHLTQADFKKYVTTEWALNESCEYWPEKVCQQLDLEREVMYLCQLFNGELR